MDFRPVERPTGASQEPVNAAEVVAVSLTAIDDGSQSSAATMSSAWLVGGTITTEIQACAIYVALPAALPEAPTVALIPIAAVAVGGGILFARRSGPPERQRHGTQ